ncbi:hypothetical protein ACFX13_011619 [Malus domestica]
MRREVAKLDASGSYREALYLHAQPVSACPREFTFPPLLKACGKLSSDQLRRHKFYIPISSKPERLCDCSRTWGLEGSSPIQLQTKTSMILACGSAEHGVEMHCLAVKLGIESDVYVATSVLTMYSNRGELVSAAKVFEEMPTKNVVSYNAFVSGLLQNGVPMWCWMRLRK